MVRREKSVEMPQKIFLDTEAMELLRSRKNKQESEKKKVKEKISSKETEHDQELNSVAVKNTEAEVDLEVVRSYQTQQARKFKKVSWKIFKTFFS